MKPNPISEHVRMREYKYLNAPESLLKASVVSLILSVGLFAGVVIGCAVDGRLGTELSAWTQSLNR